MTKPKPKPEPLEPGWVVEWRGERFREADLTGAHLDVICQLLGKDTWAVSPSVGPLTLRANIMAWLIVKGRTLADVQREMLGAPAVELAEALSFI